MLNQSTKNLKTNTPPQNNEKWEVPSHPSLGSFSLGFHLGPEASAKIKTAKSQRETASALQFGQDKVEAVNKCLGTAWKKKRRTLDYFLLRWETWGPDLLSRVSLHSSIMGQETQVDWVKCQPGIKTKTKPTPPKQPIKMTAVRLQETHRKGLFAEHLRLWRNYSSMVLVLVSIKNQTQVSRLSELLKNEENTTVFQTVTEWYPNLVFRQLI